MTRRLPLVASLLTGELKPQRGEHAPLALRAPEPTGS